MASDAKVMVMVTSGMFIYFFEVSLWSFVLSFHFLNQYWQFLSNLPMLLVFFLRNTVVLQLLTYTSATPVTFFSRLRSYGISSFQKNSIFLHLQCHFNKPVGDFATERARSKARQRKVANSISHLAPASLFQPNFWQVSYSRWNKNFKTHCPTSISFAWQTWERIELVVREREGAHEVVVDFLGLQQHFVPELSRFLSNLI